MEIIELLRMLRAGDSDRTITQRLRLNRRTIAKYRVWAQGQGLLEGALPQPAEVQRRLAASFPTALPPQQTSSVAAYQEEVAACRAQGMEIAAIRTRLQERHQTALSYSALWRLVHRLEGAPKPPEVFVRVETAPGREAQVDFGYAGLTLDPTTGNVRKTWVFVMVLSWSRHLYAELVFDQRVETWLLCHRHAFEQFGGVPQRIVPDNLKAAIVQASFDGSDPQAQRAYRECAQHYGFLIDPTPPRMPHLKGKVENGVHYVKRNFLAGRLPGESIVELNRKLGEWAEQTAGVRVHGTTKQRPRERFQQTEQAALVGLPPVPYDLAEWKQVKLHRDCYLSFGGAFYSAPYRLVGQQLWVRGGTRTVAVYTAEHELVATHDRAAPGERQTLEAHLPPEKVAGLTLSREGCRAQAAVVGPAARAVVERLLEHRPEDRLRAAGRVLRLRQTYGAERLERACARAEHFGQGDYPTLKRILQQGLDQQPWELPAPEAASRAGSPRAATPAGGVRVYRFVRQAGDLAAALLGGGR